jgi:hypothetical protein
MNFLLASIEREIKPTLILIKICHEDAGNKLLLGILTARVTGSFFDHPLCSSNAVLMMRGAASASRFKTARLVCIGEPVVT